MRSGTSLTSGGTGPLDDDVGALDLRVAELPVAEVGLDAADLGERRFAITAMAVATTRPMTTANPI